LQHRSKTADRLDSPSRKTPWIRCRRAAIERLVCHSSQFSCDQSDVSIEKPEISVASDGSDSKASFAQVACQLRPSIKLLHVRLFDSPVIPAHLSEGGEPTSQLVASLVVNELSQARPVTTLPEPAIPTVGSPRFSDVENQESSRLQGSMGLAKQPTKGGTTIPVIKKVVEAFTQRGDGGARWQITVEKGRYPEGALGHALAGDCDHVGRSVDSKHGVSSIDKPPCPQAAPAAKVYNQPIRDTPASQDVQHTGSGSLRKAPEAHIMNVGKISLVRFQLHIVE
jgi:hypothetical protein